MTPRLLLQLRTFLRLALSGRGSARSGLLLVALLCLAPVFAGLHSSQERHVVCAEHQRVEHHDAADSRASALAAGTEQTGLQLVAEQADDGAHESCSLLPSLRERSVVLVDNPDASSISACRPYSAPPADERGHVQVALLRLAPKQSPPL